ncbi:ATPase family aaa domain containing protein [Grosmannia clavigera kw1407]|uniref:ATPase family aaa domain containing protein n=1 Tax=Grosmannia clavigera (strain kw1407 / UAMH 11150) TaxID=655863 RepID=F0XFV1_GROCL|nr:ATPase family aaa domain containing protein [Grosmannia clavigera kw1407]EFX03453.1 ATPase family aaa domain containing protein [Grosmannia clavigera kw1407]
MGDRKRVGDYVMDFVLFAGMNILSSFATNLDPDKEKHDQARLRARANIQRLLKDQGGDANEAGGDGVGEDGLRGLRPEDLELNEYENMIALEVVPPGDIAVGFDDIGGLDEIIEELKESVIYPLTMPQLYSHAAPLLAAPSGVLLYGPPGCGKTMLAKALAHESGASFINLHISTLTEKWYGDSNKLVRAVFSLARKLQPAIIFIDEIDAVLGTRRSGEHEASGMVKAEFMTLWDGLTSSNAAGVPSRIVVLGATNRMHEIDEAILRRMPKKFPVPLPAAKQRLRILQLVLGETKRDPKFDIDFVANVSEGLSGSDIKEICRDAAMMPMREYLRAHHASGNPNSQINPADVRGLRTDDFFTHRNMEEIQTQTQVLAQTLAQAQAQFQAQAQAQFQAQTQAQAQAQAQPREKGTRRRSRRSSASTKKADKPAATANGDGDDDDDAYEDVDDDESLQALTVD